MQSVLVSCKVNYLYQSALALSFFFRFFVNPSGICAVILSSSVCGFGCGYRLFSVPAGIFHGQLHASSFEVYADYFYCDVFVQLAYFCRIFDEPVGHF